MMKISPLAINLHIKLSLILFACLMTTGCKTSPCNLEPTIVYVPTERQISSLPSPFDKLSKEELRQEWAKETYIGLNFANELDLYRAITAFKRALILLPASKADRRLQIEYNIFLCYYFGQKYQEALLYYDSSHLGTAACEFPPYRDLLIVLFDCYYQTGQEEKAELIREKLHGFDPTAADQLLLSTSIQEANFCLLDELKSSICDDSIDMFLTDYNLKALSVSKAKTLNALLPGAGYYYVGQKNAAATSFLINALFAWGTYAFIKNGYYAAGIITASLESGWYIGGINGAGLAANEYNERLYETSAKNVMIDNKLFPVLMLKASF
jgi:hypothetical protein